MTGLDTTVTVPAPPPSYIDASRAIERMARSKERDDDAEAMALIMKLVA